MNPNNYEPDFLQSETSSVTESWFSAPSTTATGTSKKGKRMIKRMRPRKQVSVSGQEAPEGESMWEKERNVWADLGDNDDFKSTKSRAKSIGAPTETDIIEEDEEEENNDMNLDDFDIQPAGKDPTELLKSFLDPTPIESEPVFTAPSQDTFAVAPVLKSYKTLDETLLNKDNDGLPSINELLGKSSAQLKELQANQELNEVDELLKQLNFRNQQEEAKKKPVTKKDLIQAKLQVDQLDRLKPLPKLQPLNDEQLEQKPSKIANFLKSYFNQEVKSNIVKSSDVQAESEQLVRVNEVAGSKEGEGNNEESTAMEVDEPETSNQKESTNIFGNGKVSHISSSNLHDFDSPLKLPQRQQPLKTPERPLKTINYSPSHISNQRPKKHQITPLKKFFKVPQQIIDHNNDDFDLEIIDNPSPLEAINFEIERRSFSNTKEFANSPLKMNITKKQTTPQKPKSLKELNKSLMNQMKESALKEEDYDEIDYSGDDEEEDFDMEISDDEGDNKSEKSESNGNVNGDTAVVVENVEDIGGLISYINGQPGEDHSASNNTQSNKKKKKKELNPFLDEEASVSSSDEEKSSSKKKLGKLFGEAILDEDEKSKNSDDEDSDADNDRQQRQLDRVMIDNREIEDNTDAIMKLHNKLIQDDEEEKFMAFAKKAGLDEISGSEDDGSESLGSEDSDNDDEKDEMNSEADSFIMEEEELDSSHYLKNSQQQKYTQFANITIEEELEHRSKISVRTSNLGDDFDSIRKSLLPNIAVTNSQTSLKQQRSNTLDDYLIEDSIKFVSKEDIELTEEIDIENTTITNSNFNELYGHQNTRTSISHTRYQQYLENLAKDPNAANRSKNLLDPSFVSSKNKPTTFIVRSKEDVGEDSSRFEFNVFKKFKKN
ncbi:hypothetical protein CONCODRAFT_76746 [Conidiobolus coronatus NRRL 28638]|uniref:Uncharacterized protein n=1 Tax=Conidiobolus coronatus (strain ATCC 28846 / CBS 209.66 / NRRL 28638) TaxID=796925 RepID=A0A137PI53_CONC2|nr:hypothetical protein CONCODRAFT_76746 [Conidiobolus coronatus NRRL 28638]|eukprot:KXN74674.1 hypothetical protein CONCODRAFT_76746 [Conidiobolus coronatus NRRL 28638]